VVAATDGAIEELLHAAAREGKKMADAKSLAEALEKLTTFLTSKVDGSTSGAIVPQGGVVQKVVLLPTDLKLEELVPIKILVEQMDLHGHLLGSVV
jgi:hypothetical protein